MKNKKRLVVTIILVGLIVALFFPRTIVLSPARNLLIADLYGKPIEKAIVRQVWYQYSLGIRAEEDFLSNIDGKVYLPERNVKTRNVYLLIGCILKIRKYFFDASCCTSESIGVFAKSYENIWFHNGNGMSGSMVKLLPIKDEEFKRSK